VEKISYRNIYISNTWDIFVLALLRSFRRPFRAMGKDGKGIHLFGMVREAAPIPWQL
jgi:hypothetical protein